MATIAHDVDEKERTEDIKLLRKYTFSQMFLSDYVQKGLSEAGFQWPTSVQANAIPIGKAGNDLLVQSKSGTGKTLIFCTIVLENYEPSIREAQAIIVAPTREIAVQIESNLTKIAKYCPGFKAVCVIGGMDVLTDRKKVQGAKAIVGTPGRILHLIRCQMLNISKVRILIIDEADKILSKTFENDFQQIFKSLPSKKQIIACSATLTEDFDEKLVSFMHNPILVSTDRKATFLLGIKQFVYDLPEQTVNLQETNSKVKALKRIFSAVSYNQCLLFSSSQARTETYSNLLKKDDWPCDAITGAQPQTVRLEIFKKFRDYQTRILFSTDLMSRGIDSENVNLVINLEVPNDAPTYLHRIGRAGRFGSHGVAITFICSPKDKEKFANLIESIESDMKIYRLSDQDAVPNLLENKNVQTELKLFYPFESSQADTEDKPSECDDSKIDLNKSNVSENTQNACLTPNNNIQELDILTEKDDGKIKEYSQFESICNETTEPEKCIMPKIVSSRKIRIQAQCNRCSTSSDSNDDLGLLSRRRHSKKSVLKMLINNGNSNKPVGERIEDIFDDYMKSCTKSDEKEQEETNENQQPIEEDAVRNRLLEALQNVASNIKVVNDEIEVKPKMDEKVAKPKNIYGISDSLESTTENDSDSQRNEKDLNRSTSPNKFVEKIKNGKHLKKLKSKSSSDTRLQKPNTSTTNMPNTYVEQVEVQIHNAALESDSDSKVRKTDIDRSNISNVTDEESENSKNDSLQDNRKENKVKIDSKIPIFHQHKRHSLPKEPMPSTSRQEPAAVRARNHRDSVNSDIIDNADDGESSYRSITTNASVHSSGFDEKTTSKASSGIVTSTEYFLTSEEDYCSSSSSYDSDEDYSEEYKSSSECDSATKRKDGTTGGGGGNLQELDYNARYHLAYNRWTNTYWNLFTQIRDYANFAGYVRKTHRYQ